ncbi:strictosidine synthase family protein [Maricaulis sp.]|uniref:strictosidine synthase family protein n=1 Tax=Maricaulis sp. TaxID=1486257 RepID=UPI003A91BAF2
MRNILIILGLIIAAALARMAFVIIPASGMMADLTPVTPGQCEALTIAPGTEDITIDPASNRVFVSTDDRRTGERGGIHVFDLNEPGSLHDVSGDAPADFHPHGISLWTGPDGAQRLFVVNHRAGFDIAGGTHAVEIFDVGEDGMLSHVESISHEALLSPNDVLGVGPRSFYATNDRAYHSGIMANLEAYFGLPLSSVSWFDGTDGDMVAHGIAYANGINISADGNEVYVAELLARRVRVYDRDASSGQLTADRAFAVPTAPDNIEVDERGDLWIGGHPRVFDFVAHAADAGAIAPSHAVRLNPVTGETETALLVMDGSLNASSVAAQRDGVLLVGAVFDDHILVCAGD